MTRRQPLFDDLEELSFDAKQIGNVAQAALPGMAQGATMGAAAGPWGALVGAIAGGALSASAPKPKRAPAPAAIPASPPARSLTAPPNTATAPSVASIPVQSPVATVPAAVAAPPAPGNPAAQLLWVVQNPQMLQAIASVVMGRAGQQEIPVGQTSARPAAFLNALSTLASQAAVHAEAFAEGGVDGYLLGEDGEATIDLTSPEARAAALLEHLRRTPDSPANQAIAYWLCEAAGQAASNFHSRQLPWIQQ